MADLLKEKYKKNSFINDIQDLKKLQDYILENGLSINDLLGCVCIKLHRINKEYDNCITVNGKKYEIKIKEV